MRTRSHRKLLRKLLLIIYLYNKYIIYYIYNSRDTDPKQPEAGKRDERRGAREAAVINNCAATVNVKLASAMKDAEWLAVCLVSNLRIHLESRGPEKQDTDPHPRLGSARVADPSR